MKLIYNAPLFLFLLSCSAPPEPIQLKKFTDQGSAIPENEGDNDALPEQDDRADEPKTEPVVTDKGKDEIITPVIPKPEEIKEPTVDPSKLFAGLDGFRFEFPCDTDPGASDQCNSKAKVDVTKVMEGNTSDLYTVDLHFRGVVENMMYKDGSLSGKYFYTGGVPNNGTYNIYAIEVSNPKQVYYLNYFTMVGHNTYAVDYSAALKINGGATIHFLGDGQNGIEISNFKKFKIPDVEPLSTHYNGQFLQLNVTKVELVK